MDLEGERSFHKFVGIGDPDKKLPKMLLEINDYNNYFKLTEEVSIDVCNEIQKHEEIIQERIDEHYKKVTQYVDDIMVQYIDRKIGNDEKKIQKELDLLRSLIDKQNEMLLISLKDIYQALNALVKYFQSKNGDSH